MDNRVSKSIILNSIIVKEQRVDNSRSINSHLMDLRCTLKDFERNYQLKVLSKQLKFINYFSSWTIGQGTNYKVNQWFVTAFFDAINNENNLYGPSTIQNV